MRPIEHGNNTTNATNATNATNGIELEFTAEVRMRAAQGLGATMARRVADVAKGFGATITLIASDGRGRERRADGRNLLELLLLGAGRGHAVQVRCVGTDAPAAWEAIANVLGQSEVEP